MNKSLYIIFTLGIIISLHAETKCLSPSIMSQIDNFNQFDDKGKIEFLRNYLPGKVFINPPNVIIKFLNDGRILSTYLGKQNVYVSYCEIKGTSLIVYKKDDIPYIPMKNKVEEWWDFYIKQIKNKNDFNTLSIEFKINKTKNRNGFIILDDVGKYGLIFELFERKK